MQSNTNYYRTAPYRDPNLIVSPAAPPWLQQNKSRHLAQKRQKISVLHRRSNNDEAQPSSCHHGYSELRYHELLY